MLRIYEGIEIDYKYLQHISKPESDLNHRLQEPRPAPHTLAIKRYTKTRMTKLLRIMSFMFLYPVQRCQHQLITIGASVHIFLLSAVDRFLNCLAEVERLSVLSMRRSSRSPLERICSTFLTMISCEGTLRLNDNVKYRQSCSP